jgi:hypothetical protein
LLSGLPALQVLRRYRRLCLPRVKQAVQFAENLKIDSAMKEDYLEITKDFPTPWRGARSELVTRIYAV